MSYWPFRLSYNPIGTTFRNNTVIQYFHELKYFTGIKYLASNDGTGSNSAFVECSALREITIPDQIKNIPFALFNGNTNLYQINLPANLYRIYNRVASNSRNLLKIEIPSGCAILGSSTSQGYSAFYYTKTYIMHPTTPPSVGRFDTAPAAIYVPDESIDAYKAASVWSNYASVIHPMSEYNG